MKKFLFLSVMIGSLALTTEAVPTMFTFWQSGAAKPAAQWPINDGSGTAVADTSGNSHGGTTVNTPTWTTGVDGLAGHALTFNGTSQYVTVASPPVIGNTAAFSVIAWFKISEAAPLATSRAIFSEGNSGSATQQSSVIVNTDGGLSMRIADDATQNFNSAEAYPVNDGKWHCVAYVQYSKSARALYLDGLFYVTNAVTLSTSTMNRTTLGARLKSATDLFWNGSLANISVYTSALPLGQIQALFNGGWPTGTNYYISSAGNDSNNGLTPATSWLTIGKVNAQMPTPGSVFNFKGGDTFTDSQLILTNGSTLNPVIYQSYGTGKAIIKRTTDVAVCSTNVGCWTLNNLFFTNTMPDAAMLNGATNLAYFNITTTANFRYFNPTMVNCQLGGGGYPLRFAGPVGHTDGYDNILVDHCNIGEYRVKGPRCEGDASTLYNHTNAVFSWNVISNSYGTSIANLGASGIVFNSGSGCIAAYNYITNIGFSGTVGNAGPAGYYPYFSTKCLSFSNVICNVFSTASPTFGDGDGIGFDVSAPNNTNEYNYCFNCEGPGNYCISSPGGNVCRFNLFVNCGKNGGGMSALTGSYVAYGNTIITSNYPCVNVQTACTFYNNIFQNQSGVSVICPSGAVLDGNLYYNAATPSFNVTYNGVTYILITTFRTATSQENFGAVARGVVGDPALTLPNTPSLINSPTQIAGILNQVPTGGSIADRTGLDINSLFSTNPGGIDIRGVALRSPYSIGCFDTTN